MLIGVGGGGKPRLLRVMRRGIAFIPFWKSPPSSALALKSITCLSILHSLWIGTFDGGGRFGYFAGFFGIEQR